MQNITTVGAVPVFIGWLLEGSKGWLREREPSALYSLACRGREACDQLEPTSGP